MNLLFLLAIFLSFFQFNYSIIITEKLIKIVESDDVQSFENELGKMDGVNSYIEIPKRTRGMPILCYALEKSANKIVQFLIREKADLNLIFEIDGKCKLSPLFFALLNNSHISIETLNLMLESGANINFVMVTKVGNIMNSKNQTVSLFDFIGLTEDEEKRQFIINYLIKRYEKDILPMALSKSQCLYVIKSLVGNNAYIPENIVETAIKLNAKKPIIDFLKRQLDMNNTIIAGIPCLPYELADLIHSYARGQEHSIDYMLIEAITVKDIHFIKNYLSRGGNPNYIIKKDDRSWTLLAFAICVSAEEIATFLMENGADLNLLSKDSKKFYSPLLLALQNDNISFDFVEKLLSHGADIHKIGIKKFTFRTKHYNLAALLDEREVSINRCNFVFGYLLKRFGENVLDFVLESDVQLFIVKAFISEGNAVVTRHIVEKAEKLGHCKEIIKYLNGILQLNEQLRMNNITLPGYPITLINDYYCIEESTNKEASDKCIVC